MLRIITGVPGSGKSYYAVHYLKKFVEYDQLYKEYILRSDVCLFTNIDSIRVNHKVFNEKTLEFLTVEKFREYMQKHNYKRVIMIIDEAQRFFSTEALKQQQNINDIYFFFEYHRHLGIDVFLITQSLKALSQRIVSLAEYVIEARPRTISISRIFLYDVKDVVSKMKLYTIKLPASNEIFQLYKSFEVEEFEKPRGLLQRKFLLGIAFFVIPLAIAVVLLKSGFLFSSMKKPSNSNVVASSSVSSNFANVEKKSVEKQSFNNDFVKVNDVYIDSDMKIQCKIDNLTTKRISTCSIISVFNCSNSNYRQVGFVEYQSKRYNLYVDCDLESLQSEVLQSLEEEKQVELRKELQNNVREKSNGREESFGKVLY